jgi:hypothetical protein
VQHSSHIVRTSEKGSCIGSAQSTCHHPQEQVVVAASCISSFPHQLPAPRTLGTELLSQLSCIGLIILREQVTRVCDVVLSHPIEAGNAPIDSALSLGRLTLLHAAQLPVQPAWGPRPHYNLHMQRTDGVPHTMTYETRKRACGDQDSFHARRALERRAGSM